MNCPACHQPIDVRTDRCPHCRQALSEAARNQLHALLDIREQLAYLDSLQRYLADSISVMQQRLGTLEATGEQAAATSPEAAPADTEPATEFFDSGESTTLAYPQEAPSPEGTVPERDETVPAGAGPGGLDGEIRFGQKWLLVIGIITTVFAVGYFLRYSFAQGWVGPAGRVTLAFLGGLAFLGTGEFCYRRNWERFGLYLVGGGVAVLYFAVFAGFQMYHLFPQWLSFLLMVVVTAFAEVFALVRDAKGLAVLGLIGGFGTPILLSTGVDNQAGLMTYMLILNGGVLWLASRKNWALMESLGFVFTWLLFMGWYAEFYGPDRFALTMAFMTLFFLIYAVIPVAPAVFRDLPVPGKQLWYMGPNALLAFGFSVAMIEPTYGLAMASVVTIGDAALFLFLASLLQHDVTRHRDGFWYLLGNGVFFLLVTIPVLFSGEWITVFWALEAGALLWFGRKLDRNWLAGAALVLLAIVVLKLVFYDYPVVFEMTTRPVRFRDGYAADWLTRWITAGVVLAVIWWFRGLARGAVEPLRKLADLHTIVFGALLFLLLSWETAAFFNDTAPTATFAALSVLWTTFATVLMVQGFRLRHTWLRRSAIGLFVVTLVKVFLFDIARFSTPFRILSFLVLGLVLIASSWLYYRYRDHLLGTVDEEQT